MILLLFGLKILFNVNGKGHNVTHPLFKFPLCRNILEYFGHADFGSDFGIYWQCLLWLQFSNILAMSILASILECFFAMSILAPILEYFGYIYFGSILKYDLISKL
jgi:hypothetical protein